MVHAQHLGDDIPRLAHQDGVPHPDVPLADKIQVVQRGPADGGSRQAHRLKHGVGSQHAGAAHLDDDVQQSGGLFLRGKFIGHGPPGHLCGGAQLLPLGQVIELDNDAVNAAGQGVPPVAHGADEVENILHIPGDDIRLYNFTAHLFQVLQRLVMGAEAQLPGVLHIEAEHT